MSTFSHTRVSNMDAFKSESDYTRWHATSAVLLSLTVIPFVLLGKGHLQTSPSTRLLWSPTAGSWGWIFQMEVT